MSSVSLTDSGMLSLFICIFIRESLSFPLLPMRFSWICFSLVCLTGLESLLLKSCLLLGPGSVLWTVWHESLHLAMESVALENCCISFRWIDCNFLCGFLCLSKNLFCDLLCLRWYFEVLIPEPRRRQLLTDVFMHSSFFGKLKDKKKKSELFKMQNNSQALFKCVSFLSTSNTKGHNLFTSPLPMYNLRIIKKGNKETGVSNFQSKTSLWFRV